MRRPLAIECDGAKLAATLDEADGATGLLIVSGGNETRAGAWAGQAQLAARVAAAGYPVLRYDRRGIGDSEGENRGFRASREDIAAALAVFHEKGRVGRVVALGNCDAASALMLFAADLAIDAVILANPWTVDGDDEGARTPAALRKRYREKLADPGAWKRLASGGVELGKLVAGLRQALSAAPRSSLAGLMRESLGRFRGPVTILLAERDRTAQLFEAAWDKHDDRIRRCPTASHSFAEPPARDWLLGQVLAALRGG